MIETCCDKMDLIIISKTYLKKDCFAKDIKCCSCNAIGTNYYDINKGTDYDPIHREISHE